MHLDLPTLMAAESFVAALSGLVILLGCPRGRDSRGSLWWALGGVATLVGEPQNVLVGERAGWDFIEFLLRVAPVSLPVLAAGLLTCAALEKLRWFGYGAELPVGVRSQLATVSAEASKRRPRPRCVVIRVGLRGSSPSLRRSQPRWTSMVLELV